MTATCSAPSPSPTATFSFETGQHLVRRQERRLFRVRRRAEHRAHRCRSTRTGSYPVTSRFPLAVGLSLYDYYESTEHGAQSDLRLLQLRRQRRHPARLHSRGLRRLERQRGHQRAGAEPDAEADQSTATIRSRSARPVSSWSTDQHRDALLPPARGGRGPGQFPSLHHRTELVAADGDEICAQVPPTPSAGRAARQRAAATGATPSDPSAAHTRGAAGEAGGRSSSSMWATISVAGGVAQHAAHHRALEDRLHHRHRQRVGSPLGSAAASLMRSGRTITIAASPAREVRQRRRHLGALAAASAPRPGRRARSRPSPAAGWPCR